MLSVKKSLTLFLIILLLIILGIDLKFHSFSKANYTVSGNVKYYKENLTLSGDFPQGFYIISNVFDRVYIDFDNKISKKEIVDKNILAKGTLSEIYGNDRETCYPIIKLKWFKVK